MRILFVKLSSIGDVIHTLPALSAVWRTVPNVEISWAVERSAAEILRNNPLITNLIELDTRSIRKLRSFPGELRKSGQAFSNLRDTKYDLAIDFQGLLKSSLISRLSKSKLRTGFGKPIVREPAAARFYDSVFEVEREQNVIRRNLELAEKSIRKLLSDPSMNLDREGLEFPIHTDGQHVKEAEKLSSKAGEDFVILNPAGGWPTKLWPAQNYGKLADEIFAKHGMRSIVTIGPGESSLGEEVINASDGKSAILSQPTLKGFFELAKLANAYIGGDTAPTHLAVAANCPVIGIFGPTEWWRNGSINKDDICVERNDIDCRENCHRRSCGNWICMDIDIERVRLAFERRLGL